MPRMQSPHHTHSEDVCLIKIATERARCSYRGKNHDTTTTTAEKRSPAPCSPLHLPTGTACVGKSAPSADMWESAVGVVSRQHEQLQRGGCRCCLSAPHRTLAGSR
ncbi:hypothetical protein DQ04_00451060 [Trypanosoma grayi]|uniref:hypothetical protein n=1 Tax=Trypanosoma grayi TaxID=71804 RepID=UPI0004F41FBE|nr:hypothetical protein DQ04_00451060 [Trypanosoma grayi]KEG14467.1 hypothetical protein DQ04_00451060 [Trypanosoma grayi]